MMDLAEQIGGQQSRQIRARIRAAQLMFQRIGKGDLQRGALLALAHGIRQHAFELAQ